MARASNCEAVLHREGVNWSMGHRPKKLPPPWGGGACDYSPLSISVGRRGGIRVGPFGGGRNALQNPVQDK